MKQFLQTVILLFILNLNLLAQTGSIKGTVQDSKTGETLIGATILIQGTSQGTITNFDGEFGFQKLSPGKYNLVISFISYETRIVQTEVMAGNETLVKVVLLPAVVEVGEVQVVAKKRTDTDIALLSGLKTQNLIISGISAQQISKGQDKDAAEVVRRVPGITITDGRFVIVRGLVERYNSVMLNKATAPGFEADKRAFSFDAIPSGLIDNILIYKNPAPELPADFAGAAIDIQTKNLADQNNFSLSIGGKYVEGTTFGSGFQVQSGSKTGWNNRSVELPDGVPDAPYLANLYNWPDAESYLRKTDEINRISALFNNNWNVSEKMPLPDQNFSATLQRRFVAGKVSIGNITSLNYSKSHNYIINLRTEYQDYDVQRGMMIKDFDFTDKQSREEYKTGIIHNWNMLYRKNQKLEFRNFMNLMGTMVTTQRDGINYFNAETLRMFDLRYESRLVYSGQLAGEQMFNKDRTKVNWMLGYGFTNRNQPDNRRITLVEITDESSGKFNQRYLRIQNVPNPYLAGRLWIEMKEHISNAKADIIHDFNLSGIKQPWQFKTGLFFEQKARELKSRLLGVVAIRNPQIDFFQPVEEIFNPKNFYFDRTIPYTEHGLSYRDNTRAKDSYNARDRLMAGYVALNIPVSNQINLYGGIRFENWHREISNFSEIVAGQDEKSIVRDTLDIFPSVNLTYNISEKNLFRASFGKTVNRPEFREMAPFDYQDFELFAIVYGNPGLKSSYISNYDFRYEWYPRQGEMISLAAFYKSFKNPVETFLRPSGSTYDYIPFNTEKAFSSGIEIDVRKRFEEFENTTGIARFLKDMTVVFNTSLIKSQINTSKQEFTRDTVRVMAGQSPYIVNLSLFYNNSASKWDINLTYNTIGKRLAYVGTPTRPHTWELSRNTLDLTVQKGLGEKWVFKAGVKDIFNDPVQYVQYYGANENIKVHTRKFVPNRQFSLSLVWTL